LLAPTFGWKPSSATEARTRSVSFTDTPASSFTTRETVLRLTLACAATSRIVGRRCPASGLPPESELVIGTASPFPAGGPVDGACWSVTRRVRTRHPGDADAGAVVVSVLSVEAGDKVVKYERTRYALVTELVPFLVLPTSA
jgi:hypothetical protein